MMTLKTYEIKTAEPAATVAQQQQQQQHGWHVLLCWAAAVRHSRDGNEGKKISRFRGGGGGN